MPKPPFFFPNSRVTFVFCQANISLVLPKGLMLMRPNALLVMIAQFREVYGLDTPDDTFDYDEVSFFVPVRRRFSLGLYPWFIFPTTQLPIQLGDTHYGFPKQLAQIEQRDNGTILTANDSQLTFRHSHSTHPTNEADIVATMGAWYGVPRPLTRPAFMIGDTLLGMLGSPLLRNISVYTHHQQALYSAYFNVMNWHSLALCDSTQIATDGAFFADMRLSAKKTYHTKLNMFLSAGRSLG
jgi:hypothetical protein